ncbi:hypothetical protein Pmani_010277 [Petrolisthes manimaculis]|uniref:Uncharacterized protein n=1 Tax=Petrolisthes manimaculis TaxID=1843537 RepID=A0AAE1Q2B8_9EUCA|nr:hypothetical protein Pmani_010277 [Petrolisthes manimaculis]
MKSVIKKAGTPPSWEEVKRLFKLIYPNEITEDHLRVKLGEAQRKVGEKSPAHQEIDIREPTRYASHVKNQATCLEIVTIGRTDQEIISKLNMDNEDNGKANIGGKE